MAGVNKAIIVGNIGAEVKYKETEGYNVANASVATSEKYKDKPEVTEWHRITAFGKTADFLSKLGKGTKVYVEGRIQTRKYKKEDGTEAYTTEIIAQSVQALSPKPKTESSGDDMPY